MLRIHDTMAGHKVDFTPRTPGQVSMYVCGPTVYDVPHLGHGRAALVFDVIRRYLQWRGYSVTYVSNVTDIDDRIIARAAESGSTEPELAERFTEAYWAELDRLGVARPDEVPHATSFVDRMQELIGELVERGAAYVIEGEGVYFSVDGFPGYGELSHRRAEDLVEGAGARVAVEERKRSPLDFALWKAAKPGEPRWKSPWGPGRPGWHIECAAMSLEILGEGFDLHGGGDDLVFPHHENERAEAEAAGHRFARYWLHNAMVNVGGEKMSKSLGNFTNLSDAIDAVGPRAFRLAVLRAHYRTQIELGRDALDDASRAIERLDALARRAVAIQRSDARDEPLIEQFRTAMDDDFATHRALAAIFDGVTEANQAVDAGDTTRASVLLGTLPELLDVLGIPPQVYAQGEAGIKVIAAGEGEVSDDEGEIEAMVRAREQARVARDFTEADRIRDELAERGVKVEDTAQGPVWRR